MFPMLEHLQTLGLRSTRRVVWRIDDSIRDRSRRYAVTDTNDFSLAFGAQDVRILVASDLHDLSFEHQQMILLHEWGHAVDFLYPALIDVSGPLRWHWKRPTLANQAAWLERTHDEIEQMADRLVLGLWGIVVGYKGKKKLQSWSGTARPPGLR